MHYASEGYTYSAYSLLCLMDTHQGDVLFMTHILSLRRSIAAVLLAATLMATGGSGVSAATETVEADLGGNCSNFSKGYTATLRNGGMPDTATFTFSDGTEVVVNRSGMYDSEKRTGFFLVGYADKLIVSITTEVDTEAYPNWSFTTGVSNPCTYEVSGVVTQFANEKPVAGADVCIVELGLCTVTDADGAYFFPRVINGDFTLVSTAPVYKTVTESVLVVRADTVQDITQYRGND